MFHFDDSMREAINKWAKAKGINPKDIYMANGWGTGDKEENIKVFINCPPIPLGMLVKGQINTSVFEEAEIVE